MTPEELIEHYPVLYHMAERDSWPRIQRLGLRTTTQLVDECNPHPTVRSAILDQRRPESIELAHPIVGTITVRDQKPLKLHNLELTDTTLEGFLDLLNTRVFMWTTAARLDRLLGARPYRNSVHDVLVLDTASIVETYAQDIRLTGMNTGATIFPTAPPRGVESFMTIAEFPFADRMRGKALEDNVVELCVVDGVDFIEDHVLWVERRQGVEVLEIVHER